VLVIFHRTGGSELPRVDTSAGRQDAVNVNSLTALAGAGPLLALASVLGGATRDGSALPLAHPSFGSCIRWAGRSRYRRRADQRCGWHFSSCRGRGRDGQRRDDRNGGNTGGNRRRWPNLDADGFLFSPLTWGHGIITTPATYDVFLRTIASHGFAAVRVGAHPSIVTTISIHGHTTTSALHGPLLQTTGTMDNVGVPLQQATFDQSMVQTFLATLDGATHFEILASGGGREGGPIVAWLRFWVYGDQGARGFLYGNDCTLCVAPWTQPQRKNWQ
jgi:hypothetical protein